MTKKRKITKRPIDEAAYHNLTGLPDVLRRLYASRGITGREDVDYTLNGLIVPEKLYQISDAAKALAAAIENNERLLVIGDFDADGATSTALCVSALKAFGAQQVNFLVPNRFEFGYGLSPEIVEVAHKLHEPQWIITVDNGVANHQGVALAKELGMKVLVTDHHLPGETLPDADIIVNPNLRECDFPSKSLAGVGVIFYVMLALRRELESRAWFDNTQIKRPNMSQFLDLVALGTVADVVPLDHNNRILVSEGLKRMRHGLMRPGIKALLQIAKRDHRQLTSKDLGFAIGPRLNAAGRLEDMSIGISCLLESNPDIALERAKSLNVLNEKRKEIEGEMKVVAFFELDNLFEQGAIPHGVAVFDASWHQGVIGILAGRIKEKYLRPTIVFANGEKGMLKGSARSVPGLNIRDVLAEIAAGDPKLIPKFGGHAMAAGLSIEAISFDYFKKRFNDVVGSKMSIQELEGELYCDGPLKADEINLETVSLLEGAGPFGQSFPEPQFLNEFTVLEMRIVGERHLRLRVRHQDSPRPITGIWFNADLEYATVGQGARIRILYDIAMNEFRDVKSVQLMVKYVEICEDALLAY